MRSRKKKQIVTLFVLMCFIVQILMPVVTSATTLKKHVQIILGQSVMLKVEGIIKRVTIGNNAIADYSVISKDEIMILASKIGKTELYVWLNDDNETKLVYNLIVYDDLADLRTKLLQVLGPKATRKIKLVLAKETVILKGVVSSQYEAQQAEEVAQLYYKVMNLLEVKKDVVELKTDKMTPEEISRLNMEEKYKKAMDKTSRIFRLRNADAAKAKAMFEKMKSREGYLEIDARTNSLLVIDKPAIVQRMSAFLSVIDEPEPQVLIEAKVIEVTLGNDMSSAFDWIYDTLYSGSNPMTKLSNKSVSVNKGQLALNLDYGKISNNHFTAQVLPKLSERHSRLVSNPTTVTMNRHEAQIKINDKIPYITFTPQGSTGTLVPQTKSLDAGINLTVTPTVLEGGDVRLDLKISVSSFIENVDFGQYGTVPRTFDKTSQNVVVVPNDNTLVIGGLIKDDLKNTDVKVPWFGRLPIIKNMFRNSKNENSRTELLMFVTPKVIYPDGKMQISTKDYPEIGKAQISYNSLLNRKQKRYQKEYNGNYPKEIKLNDRKNKVKKELSRNNLEEIPSLTQKFVKNNRTSYHEQKNLVKATKINKRKIVLVSKNVESKSNHLKNVRKNLIAKRVFKRSEETRKMLQQIKNEFTTKKPIRKTEKKVVIKTKKRKRNSVVKIVESFARKIEKDITPRRKKISKKVKKDSPFRNIETVKLLKELKSNKSNRSLTTVKKLSSKKIVVRHRKSKKNMKLAHKVVKNSSKTKLLAKKKNFISQKKLNQLAKADFMRKIKELKLSKSDLNDRFSKKERESIIRKMKKEMASSAVSGGVM